MGANSFFYELAGKQTNIWKNYCSKWPWAIGLIIINNLAIVVEGFLTDILLEHLAMDDLSEPEQITMMYKKGGGWNQKKSFIMKFFKSKLRAMAIMSLSNTCFS